MPCEYTPTRTLSASSSPTLTITSLRSRHGFTLAEAVEPREEGKVLEAGQPKVERAVAGWDKSDPLPEAARIVHRVETRGRHRAGVGVQQPRQDPEQRGLARSVRSEQRMDLACPDAEA